MARGRRRGRDKAAEPEEPEQVEIAEEQAQVEEHAEEEPAAEDADQDVEMPDPASEHEPEVPGELLSLKFDEELTWRPGKPIPLQTLLGRLERLSQELSSMEQDHVDLDSLADVSHALGQRNLLTHKDQGVKAYVAACIVDILQLSAPDAPFTSDQLKIFFTMLVSHIFPCLGDQSHPYHNQHKYILASLAEVQSILLINDVDGADDLLLRLFSAFFDTASGTGLEQGVAKDIGASMTEILVALIEHSSGVSPKIIEVIMAQFLRAAPPGGAHARGDRSGHHAAQQSTLLLKSEPPAYLMAKEICNQCSDKMVQYVSQYFSDVIIDASRFAVKSNGHRHDDEHDDDDGPRGPTEAELKELRKAHLLIKELWRAAPDVLQNVIPQVEAELSADNVELRQIATETLGDMIAGIGAAGPPPAPIIDPAAYPPLRLSDEEPDTTTATSALTTPLSPQSFAQTHAVAYHSFLGRRQDRTPAVRAAWTTTVGYILSTSAGGIGLSREEQAELIRALGDKLNDSDERVRLAAVQTMELFGFRDFVLKLGPTGGIDKEGSILRSLADRCRDKRPAVRVDAMTFLGNLWGVGAGELASGQDVVMPLNGIPSVVYKAWYANDLELNILIDRVIFECLLPLSFPPIKSKGTKASASQSQPSGTGTVSDQDRIRAERILLLVQSLDPQAKKSFFTMQARQPQFAGVLEAFIKQCEAYNGGVMDGAGPRKTAALEKTIQYIAQFFPDAAKVKSDLYKFAKANDRRNYQLIRFSIGSENDYKTVRGGIKELVKRMQGGPAASALDTLIPFLYRSACLIFNRSHLSTILDYSKTDKDGFGPVAHEILHEISLRNPDMFKTFVVDLCKELVQQSPSEHNENDPAVVDILRACSAFAKKYPDEIPNTKEFGRALTSYAQFGRPVKAAKYAIKILLAKGDKQGLVLATSLFDRVMANFEYGSPYFLNKLQCLAQLYLQAPKVTEGSDQEIVDMAVQKIARQVRTEASDKDPEWVDDADMDEELRAKELSLRIAVNRVRSVEDVEEAKAQAGPVFKLLMTLVTKQGELCKEKDTPNHHKARLRLLAGQLVLKLCTQKHFDDIFSHKDFHNLAFMTQDREPAVRRGFVEKLMKNLVLNRLRHRFYTMIFLTAYEPMADFKQHIETWIRSRVQFMQSNGDKNNMEALIGRLIPLLAHHPDYSPEMEYLVDHARYLVFYVSHVATEKNLGLIHRYAERVKQTRDLLNPEKSENLYVLSDLAQAVIRKWQEKKGWSFQAYPGKVGLPMGLYAALPSHDVAQEVARKLYIPDGIENRLDEVLRSVDKKKKRKTTDDRGEGGSAAKRIRTKEPKPQTTKATIASKKSKPAAKPKPKPKSSKPKMRKESELAMDEGERRRSGRSRKSTSAYQERHSSEDDAEMWEGVAEWEYEGEEGGGGEKSAAEGDDGDVVSGEEPGSDITQEDDEAEPALKKKKKRTAAAATAVAKAKAAKKKAEDRDDDDSSVLSEPESSVLSEPQDDGEEADKEDEEDEEGDEGTSPTTARTRSTGRKGRNAASAELPSRPAVKKPPPPGKKQQAAASAGTRTRASRPAAREVSDSEFDGD
ncbi:hypothetical protein SODALDRAFT_320380 [Sodiomyces alkalinus F11]|uniref:Uncharacterized protein n=1 Tax=Sodiomyces alkalinus (strain CBS 110278 / VKM F-3762 / F11) TaxID=1314773 RepID=A0A3N2PN85_SODAK|nr:hypothetical protein SODALDRAFT_320380 [Sodiomyces alkalinus F11]ROT35894.1 hypothetical protein SODALDRAFT_320380 [Sodiomyces alkalinus F11]